jgi:RTX calcium-binding nonapeptide repeat (4 copies)
VKNGTGFCRPMDRRVQMRRIAMIVAVVMALSAFLATAAFAANQIIQCSGIPCTATGTQDLVKERIGNRLNDKIYLKAGSDQVRADKYRADRDLIYGGKGYDLIYTNDGDIHDRIRGGAGNDRCYVDARVEVVGGCSRVIVQ